jgi:hypothetical protein
MIGILTVAFAVAGLQPEKVTLWHPPSASNVVKSVEARCGPNRYQMTWSPLNRGRAEQILSLARDDIQFGPEEIGKIFRNDNFMIEDVSFGTCIIKNGRYIGVKMMFHLAYPMDEKLRIRGVELIGSSIVPEE